MRSRRTAEMNGRGHATLIKGSVTALRSIDLLAAPESEGKAVYLHTTSVKRGASLVFNFRAADLNLFKKRLTVEMTWGETADTQREGKETPLKTKSLFRPHVH